MAVSSSPAAGDSPSAVASFLAVLGVGGGAAAPWRMHASAAKEGCQHGSVLRHS